MISTSKVSSRTRLSFSIYRNKIKIRVSSMSKARSRISNLADIYDMHIILWTNFYSWTILFRNLPDINWFTVTYSVFSQSRCRLSGKEISIDFWELIGSRRELFAMTTRLLRSLWKIPFWFTVLDLPYSIDYWVEISVYRDIKTVGSLILTELCVRILQQW